MNILILPSWYKSIYNHTLGSFFREQAIALSNSGHNVSLIYCNTDLYKNKHLYNDIKESYNDNGVNTYILNKFYFFRGMATITNVIGTLKMIKRFKKDNKIDFIHAHSFKAGFIASLVKKIFRIPYIITEHNTKFSRNALTKKDKFMAKVAFSNADKVIAVSEGLRRDLGDYYSGEIKVINNMVDSSFLERDINRKNTSIFTFFCCAYLTEKKGIDILINAISILKEKNIDCKLIIGGDGEEREKLEMLTLKLGLQDRILFKGSLDRDEVIENLGESDAFVLPSRHETFGIVFIEALAMGRPVIMTDTDAAKTIVNDSTGIVVPKESVIELANAMQKMVKGISLYNKSEIREYCRQNFSEKAIINQLNDIYGMYINVKN